MPVWNAVGLNWGRLFFFFLNSSSSEAALGNFTPEFVCWAWSPMEQPWSVTPDWWILQVPVSPVHTVTVHSYKCQLWVRPNWLLLAVLLWDQTFFWCVTCLSGMLRFGLIFSFLFCFSYQCHWNFENTVQCLRLLNTFLLYPNCAVMYTMDSLLYLHGWYICESVLLNM